MVVLLLAASGLAADKTKPANAELSKQAYERIRSLVGRWIGRSTKGWNEHIHGYRSGRSRDQGPWYETKETFVQKKLYLLRSYP
jgi:hypothetical protein